MSLRPFTNPTFLLLCIWVILGAIATAEARPRFGGGSVSATGPNGGSIDASGGRVGRFGAGKVTVTGPNGNTATRVSAGFTGYRRGYVYRGGIYHSAPVTVNTLYVAPLGVYAGWKVLARPAYIACAPFATYPIEVAAQIELKNRGYYSGSIDGIIGKMTKSAIRQFQNDHRIAVTGALNKPTLVALKVL